MKTRAAIYVRISLDREGSGLGVERQEKQCRELCTRKGWDVADVYVDNDVSASSSKPRPEWQRLLVDVRAGHIDAIAVWHVDRMTRKPRELEDVIDLAEKLGVQLGTVAGEIDLATPTGKMIARMLGAAARHEAEHKGERQRVAFAQAAAAGKPHIGGYRPFGYLDCRVRINVDEAALIREAARRLLAGETLRSIATDWNTRDVKTTGGKQWTGQAIKQIMTSARISGRREIGRVKRHQLGNIACEDAFEPIISVADSDRLRLLLTNPDRRAHTSSTTRRYLLSGMLTCHRCGGTLNALAGKPEKNRPAMYRCASAGQYSSKTCGRTSVLMKHVEPVVRNDLLAAIESPELIARLHERAELDPKIGQQIKRDEQELIDIAADRADGTITRAEWVTMRERVQQRLDDNKAHVARQSDTEALSLLDGDGDIEDRWARLNLAQQRAVVSEVFAEIVVMQTPYRGAKFSPDRIKSSYRF